MIEMVSHGENRLDSTASSKNILSDEKTFYTNNGPEFSVDDAVNTVGYGKFQIQLTCLAGLGWIADAFEILILSLIGDLVACDWPLLRWQNAVLTSAVFGAMMIGSPIFGTIADIYGRKKSLAGSVILLFIFGTVSAASPSYSWMVAFRCCMGFALGGVAQGLTLCSEYFPSNVRGKAGFYLGYFWSIGTIGVILITWVIMEYLESWRVLLVVASIPALIVIFSIKWYPESARYYLVSNQYDQARKIIGRMASMNGKDLPPGNLAQGSACARRGRIYDLFDRKYRRGTLLFWYIWFSVAFAYFGVALLSPAIIKDGSLRLAHSKNNDSRDLSSDMQSLVPCARFTQENYIDLLWTSAAEFPGLILFTLLIERCNRKVLLSASCLISGGLVFLLLLETEFKFIILLFLFGARAILVADFQLIYVMTSESFPTTVRAIAMGSGTSFCRLGGLVVPYVAQGLALQNPTAAISVLGGMIVLAAVAAAFLPFEMRGAHMQESDNSKQ